MEASDDLRAHLSIAVEGSVVPYGGFVSIRDMRKPPQVTWPLPTGGQINMLVIFEEFGQRILRLVADITSNENRREILPYEIPRIPPGELAAITIVVAVQSAPLPADVEISRRQFRDVYSLLRGLGARPRNISRIQVGGQTRTPTADYTQALGSNEARFCRCTLHVGERNPSWCNAEQAWGETRNGRTCHNPHAVCAVSTGVAPLACGPFFNFEALSDAELVAYAETRGIRVRAPYSRDDLLEAIAAEKEDE